MHGHATILDRHSGLAGLAYRQAGVVTRAQLAPLGIQPRHVAGHLHARRWREPTPGVLVVHRGPLSEESCRWIATLAAGVVVHESRRHHPEAVVTRRGLPVHHVERAAIDAATWSSELRTASGVLAAVVQQRLTTASALRVTLDEAGRIRHRKALFLALADIEGGAQALSEIDVARLCRSARLPEPTRQRVRTDTRGRRRYLDAEWVLPTGDVVVLEIDGIGHMDPLRWYADLLREAELVIPGRHRVIRLPATAARLEPERVVAILRRALA